MSEPAANPMQAWEAFYVIVGSSAGALTGLQFVVLTMISEAGVVRGTPDTLSAFASPNVVHFCAALLVSALFSAPWHDLSGPGLLALLCGLGGLVYSIAVLRRARRQRDYQPVLEDWIWHAVLPFLAYAGLVFAGIELQGAPDMALYVVAGSALLLVFVGIHNAWDTVTYVMSERLREQAAAAATRKTAASAELTVPAPAPTESAPVAPDPQVPGSGA